MPIRFKCSCGSPLRAADENVGKRLKCPTCGEIVVVPDQRTATKRTVKEPEVVDDEEEELPRRRKRPAPQKSAAPLIIVAVAAGVLLLAGGGTAAWFLWLKPSDDSKDTGGSARSNGDKPDTKIDNPTHRAKSKNNLMQIGLGIHNYQTALGTMPPPAIYGRNGQPLLSWRVALLPWLEQEELYQQFKLDEPWDSAHNKKLLAKMPQIYAPVTGESKEAHSTYYQVFTGPQTPFVGNAKRNITRAFTDGTSNTFMVVEAGEAVPWTKPEDLPYDAKKPVPKLGGLFSEGFHVCMGDASVRYIKKDIDEKLLRALITSTGAESIDWNKVPMK